MNSTTSISDSRKRKVPSPFSRRVRVIGLSLVTTAILVPRLEAMNPNDLLPTFATIPLQFQLPADATTTAKKLCNQILRQLVSHDDAFAKRLGFNSARQVATLACPSSFQSPFAVVRVGLKQLQQYLPSHNPISLLSDDSNWRPTGVSPRFSAVRFLFPIWAGGTVRSSALISMSHADKWDVQQIGSKKLIKQLVTHGSSTTHFVIWIPGLNRYYLGRIDPLNVLVNPSDNFFIKTIFYDPLLSLPAGSELLAKDAFGVLKTEALTINLADPDAPPG